MAMVTTAAACSTGGSDEKIALKGVKACEVLTPAQLATYGVQKVTQDATQDALTGSFSRCVWQSPVGHPFHSLAVSLDGDRINDWVGDKYKTERLSGLRASRTGSTLYVATGPERGVVDVEAEAATRPAREIAQAVVDYLRQRAA
jgi:hypothetical protein